ncbi:hypothetical protein PVMG_05340 [Plasmodium vivax Mauritania I]|uniref:Variable surface protein n=2 Tax=Plasmodium vivax TaxID=5855 RepID=A0A0J9TKW4_PLAVI|nr:hypothetical protein PVBG_05226 [Plasmodium vivax Brazil I]KMZ95741.1 hypothetical protein PVMG_05340 [Plasmodium vivax Mauritania I]
MNRIKMIVNFFNFNTIIHYMYTANNNNNHSFLFEMLHKNYVSFHLNCYPFLINTWNLYEEIDKPVLDKTMISFFDNFCHVFIGNSDNENENYKNVCMNLMKNLGVYPNDTTPISLSNEHCNTLNYWLYYHKCVNNYDEKIKDPLKMIKLYNLQDNIEIFLSTLKQKGTDDYCSCKKYIYACVNIYKDMNEKYCTDPVNSDNKNTCDKLDAFKISYTENLFEKIDIGEKIQSLLSEGKENMEECLSAQSSVTGAITQQSNSHSSTTGGVTTALCTIAGASSVLALLYKVNDNFHLNI